MFSGAVGCKRQSYAVSAEGSGISEQDWILRKGLLRLEASI